MGRRRFFLLPVTGRGEGAGRRMGGSADLRGWLRRRWSRGWHLHRRRRLGGNLAWRRWHFDWRRFRLPLRSRRHDVRLARCGWRHLLWLRLGHRLRCGLGLGWRHRHFFRRRRFGCLWSRLRFFFRFWLRQRFRFGRDDGLRRRRDGRGRFGFRFLRCRLRRRLYLALDGGDLERSWVIGVGAVTRPRRFHPLTLPIEGRVGSSLPGFRLQRLQRVPFDRRQGRGFVDALLDDLFPAERKYLLEETSHTSCCLRRLGRQGEPRSDGRRHGR